MIFLWISLYGLVYIVAEKLAVTSVAMLAYTGALLFWLYKTDRLQEIGLKKISFDKKLLFWFIPIVILPILNLLAANGMDLNASWILLMMSVAVVEEIFFRGFLLHMLLKMGIFYGLIFTNIIFSAFHLVNVTRIAELKYVIIQMIYAFIVGIYYSVLVVKFQSLLPCILSHFLINITSGGNSMNLYIDPGTGSMLFTVLIGIIGAAKHS